jgi:tRNA nucleotidyltransferase (CCA-adding enzyme)
MYMDKMLESISLNKKEKKELDRKVKDFLKKLENKDIKFFIGGSYAKNTFLKGNLDIDIFAMFDCKENKYEDISKKLGKFLKSKFKKVETVHGSRDYFHIKQDDLIFEIVPVLKIKKSSQAENIMDVSPLHVKFVKRRVGKKLKKDVMLLKQFFRANNLYGAESYIRGFSGYICELLIIYYGGFDELIKSVREWDEKKIIHFGRNSEKAFAKLSKSKKNSSLVVIDPVQKDRNASAALSKKNYEKFISLCKAYNGNKSFFVRKEVILSKLKGYVILKINPKEGKKDIIGAKLLASLERLKKEFEMYDFKIKDYGWKFEDYAYFWFKADKLEKNKIHFGPKVSDKVNRVAFNKRWKNVKVSKGRVYTILKRKYLSLEEYSKYLIRQKWLKERVKSVKIYK